MERILQYGISSNLGGIESYVLQQMEHIDHNLLVYDFLYYGPSDSFPFEKQIVENGGKIYYLPWPKKKPKNFFSFYLQLLKIFKNNHYKAITLNVITLRNSSILFVAKFCGIPLRIIHSHNGGTAIKKSIKNKIIKTVDKIILKFSVTHYFACSDLAGKWMFGNKCAFTLVPNAIDCRKFKFNPSMRNKLRNEMNLENEFIVGHVARFCCQKNNEFVIDIFNQIHKNKKESVLLLIGSYNSDDEEKMVYHRVKNRIQKYNLQNSVIFLGMRKDVFNLYQVMDCLVLPSLFEGFPVVGIEAQAAGLPCYFSKNITREVNITDSITYLSLNQSPEFWAKKILEMPNIKRAGMAEKVAKAGYDIKIAAKKIQEFYLQ